jgi:hypothetical protein
MPDRRALQTGELKAAGRWRARFFGLLILALFLAGPLWWFVDNLVSASPSKEIAALSGVAALMVIGMSAFVVAANRLGPLSKGAAPTPSHLRLFAALMFFFAADLALLWIPDWLGLIDMASLSGKARATPVIGPFVSLTSVAWALLFLRRARHGKPTKAPQ